MGKRSQEIRFRFGGRLWTVEDAGPYKVNDVLSDECAKSVGVIYTSSVTLRATPRCFVSQNLVVACDIVLTMSSIYESFY